MSGRNFDTADAFATARAVAINRNKNFIIFPDYNGSNWLSSHNRDDDDRDRQDLEGLFRKSPRDNEAESNAVAAGKAVVCNQNINVVIY